MDRKRSVLAASGVSAVLVVGSSAFAVANGIFVTKPVHHPPSLQAAKILVPHLLRPVSTSTVAVPPPRVPLPVPSVAPSPPRVQYRVAAPERFSAPVSVPAIQPAMASTITHSGPSAVSAAHDDDRDREPAKGVERDD